MKIQSIVFCNEVCSNEELYYRKSGKVNIINDYFWMKQGSLITTDTYLNVFDSYIWTQYTGCNRFYFNISLTGAGTIRLYSGNNEERQLLQKVSFSVQNQELQLLKFVFETQLENAFIFYELEASTDVRIQEAYYEILDEDCSQHSEINLSVVICTYQRKIEVLHNIKKLKNSEFFQPESVLNGHMDVHVVDNASELKLMDEEYYHFYHNPNTGGSGGFTRGIHEVRNRMKVYSATNVIFMDDDVGFMNETFYRLYALLTYMKPEYQNGVIAGRMFRMDRREVQYTAVEIWNRGNIKHIGENLDMTKIDNLNNMNQRNGEYTGWWFGCFPMDFVMQNDPMPFFLHCDDVEYGLRHGGVPIVLNGIQVWHETYEYRQSPIIAYYDMRNALFVNDMYQINQTRTLIHSDWKKQITKAHIDRNWLLEYMLIQALRDYDKGVKWLMKVKPDKEHQKLKKRKGNRIVNSFLWRYTSYKFLENK